MALFYNSPPSNRIPYDTTPPNTLTLDADTIHSMFSATVPSGEKRDFDKVASLMAAIMLVANEYGAVFSAQGRKASFWWQSKEYTVSDEGGRWSVSETHHDNANSVSLPRKRSACDYDSGFEEDYPDKRLKPLRTLIEQHNASRHPEQHLPSLRAIAEECRHRHSPALRHNNPHHDSESHDVSHDMPPGPPLTMYLPRSLTHAGDATTTRPVASASSTSSASSASSSSSSSSSSPSSSPNTRPHQRHLHYIVNGEVRSVHPLSPSRLATKVITSPTPVHHHMPRWEAALYIPQTPSPKPDDHRGHRLLPSIKFPIAVRRQGKDNSTAISSPSSPSPSSSMTTSTTCSCSSASCTNNDDAWASPRRELTFTPSHPVSPAADRDVSPLALTPPRITSVDQLRSLTEVVDNVRVGAGTADRSIAKAVERWEEEVARVSEVESW
ncbi:hypothetical protein BC936DRAFT_149968 [Jimgerdemannia flammicorona]|uniref:Uncharacterized protein n=1 Tax=Jimgerdemannia flammicorona TaxID=994334 RepID=A0A433CZR7_9FUNG|nr:hypothetical protein BC936DRAFT_149968 [Jimgerdemannia flammicorona]